MNLPSRGLALRRLILKDRAVLALDTGLQPESAEGLRLAKVSRGTGWFWHAGRLVPWTTRGVVQEGGRLLVWGESDDCPEGESPSVWPVGPGSDEFLKALVAAWTSLSPEELGPFTPSGVVPYQTSQGWAFAFLPDGTRSALDSFQPRAERLAWEPLLRPDSTPDVSWMFASAALGLAAWGPLPWAQDEEEALRQEMRELGKTLVPEELPDLDPETQKLWFDSLVGQGTAEGWRAWLGRPSWRLGTPQGEGPRRLQARARRAQRRGRTAFWRRRGTLVTVISAVSLALVLIVGSVVWGVIKPDPTDTWTPQEVVRGYYTGLETLDDQLLGKLSSGAHDATVAKDRDEVTNRYVIRQVRTAYELQSPVLAAAAWEKAGKPPLVAGQILYGLTGLSLEGSGTRWTVRYHRWISDGGDAATPPQAMGEAVVDELTLVKTDRGWKVSGLRRQSQPLS